MLDPADLAIVDLDQLGIYSQSFASLYWMVRNFEYCRENYKAKMFGYMKIR
jgi:hypothetical protein